MMMSHGSRATPRTIKTLRTSPGLGKSVSSNRWGREPDRLTAVIAVPSCPLEAMDLLPSERVFQQLGDQTDVRGA